MTTSKLKKNLCYLTLLTLSSSALFPLASENKTQINIEIIKENLKEIDSRLSSVTIQNTKRGFPIASAYLTPGKNFGYMYIENHNYNDSGNLKTYMDELNKDNPWGGVEEDTPLASNNLYNQAKGYFLEENSPIKKSILNLNEKTLEKGLYNIQKSDDGREFVSSSLYLRYIYDVDDSDFRYNKYEKSSPILDNNYINGPYFAMGDYIDSNIDVINLKEAKETIKNNPDMYFKSLSSLGTIIQVNDVLSLTKDKDYNKSHSQEFNETNKAMFEKRFEYRRYISSERNSFTNYEIVYPVTYTYLK